MFAFERAGDKIHILYQYEYINLPWNKEFLEKYIPYEVAVTELSFERIVGALWKKCGLQQAAELKLEDVKYIPRMPVSNRVLTEICELKTYAPVLRMRRVAIRKVELFLNEFVLICKMNERYRQNGEQSALFAQMKEEFRLLGHFVDKLSEIIQHNRVLKAREMQWKNGEARTVYEHDDLLRKLKKEVSNFNPANEAEREAFIKELGQLYREGKLNPEEERIIEEMLLFTDE